MRDALLRDLALLPYEISTTVDARLSEPVLVPRAISVHKEDDVWQLWEAAIKAVDAVWLIAPETGGLLKRLTELAVKNQKIVIGCGIKSIEITSSKLATYHVLQKAGIATIPTFTLENWPKSQGQWLAKPDDGAGCDETFYFESREALVGCRASWILAGSHIIQPFQAGKAASISCVMQASKAQILSCNSQMIELKNNQLKFSGCIVNGMRDYWQTFETIANQIAEVLPDLAGYVGIDVMVDGSHVMVVEINPRLTTSYCGLAKAAGANPAKLIIDALTQENVTWPILQQNRATIDV